MARTPRLTDAKIRDLDPQDKPYSVPVEGLPLKVVVSPKGTKSFVLKFRIYHADRKPQQVEAVVGTTGDMDLEEACERSRTLIASGKNGVDHRLIWKKEAAEFARQIQTEQMEALGTTDPENLEFLETAWKKFYNEKQNQAARHKAKMLGCWRHVVAHLEPTIRTKELTAADVAKIKERLAGTPQEFNKFLSALSGVLKHEIAAGRLEKYVLMGVKKYPSQYRMTILNEKGIKQFQEFYGNMDNFAPIDQPHARFLLGLLYTGMRPKTLRTLEKVDNGTNNFVDWKRGPNGVIVIRKDKTSSKRKAPFVPVPITSQAAAIMRAASAATPWSPFIFGSNDSRKRFCEMSLSVKRTEQLFRRHATRFEVEGYEKLDIYSLRHTFGSMSAARNIPLNAVKDMMTHASVTTTEKYLKTTEQGRLAAARKIQDIF
jgi:integrase